MIGIIGDAAVVLETGPEIEIVGREGLAPGPGLAGVGLAPESERETGIANVIGIKTEKRTGRRIEKERRGDFHLSRIII